MPNTPKIIGILDKISEWVLYVLIFALPFSKSIIEITAITAIVCYVLKTVILRKSPFKKDPISIFLYLFVIANVLSLINTQYMTLSMRAFFSKTLEYVLLFVVAREVIDTKAKLNNFMTMAFISCVIIVIDGLTQHFITHVDFLHNYTSFNYVLTSSYLGAPTASFPFPNDFSAWILMFIFPVISIGLFSVKSRIKQITFMFTGLLLALLLFLAQVRGAWASFMVVSGAVALTRLKKVIIVLLIFVAAIILIMEKSTLQYISNTTSIRDRSEMWSNGWKIFKKHPILGNGVNTFYPEYKKIRNDEYHNILGSYSHNCYLQMASEIGLLGLSCFLLFIGGILIKGFTVLHRIRDNTFKPLILGLNLGLTAFLIHSFVDTNLYSLNLAVLFWVTAGVMLASVKISEKIS